MSKKEGKTAAKAISESAHEIWLAGLGAFAKAQAEGSRVFEKLIKEGAELEAKARKHGKENIGRIRDQVIQAGEKLRKRGEEGMSRIQDAIDDRVAEAVARLSLPTQADLARLTERLEELGRDFSRSTTRTVRAAGEAFQDVARTGAAGDSTARPRKAPAKRAAAKKAGKANAARRKPADAGTTGKSGGRATTKKSRPPRKRA